MPFVLLKVDLLRCNTAGLWFLEKERGRRFCFKLGGGGIMSYWDKGTSITSRAGKLLDMEEQFQK